MQKVSEIQDLKNYITTTHRYNFLRPPPRFTSCFIHIYLMYVLSDVDSKRVEICQMYYVLNVKYKRTPTYFMFCWPCISIHPRNENQLDALFILSLFRQSTSTSVGHICSQFHPNPANRQSTKKHNTYQLSYIHSIPPDDGLQICRKHVEVDWK
jgi:hypothetical protein